MRTDQLARFLAPLALVMAASFSFVACGGGGGEGGTNGSAGDAVVMGIIVQGIAEPLHDNGTDNPGGVLPVGAFLNARVTFTFGGPVDPSSIPGAGPAQSGSIQIVDVGSNLPANGVFSVNPANTNQVIFDAFPPSTGAACQAGFTSSTTYRINVNTASAGNGPAVRVSGTPLQRGANPAFRVRTCGAPTDTPFTDSNGVAPSVVATNPVAGSTVNATAIAGFPNNSIVTVDVDEAIDPQSVSAASVVLVNRTINPNADIPAGASVSFTQFGLVPGNSSISRIIVSTSLPLADGHTYEIRFSGVTDLAGNPLMVAPNTLVFTINNLNNGVPVNFTDDFSATTNRSDIAGAIVWPGTVGGDPNSGHIAATFPVEVIGNGLDGVGNFATTMTINSDNQLTPGDPEAEPATYNFTSLSIGSGPTFVLTFQSNTDTPPGQVNWPVRFRSMTTINILQEATINCNGRQNPTIGGVQAGGSTAIPGGWGGPGAGRGGTGSPVISTTIDSEFALDGEGAHTDPVFNNQPGGSLGNVTTTFPAGTRNAFFGGGGGGQGGFITSPGFAMFGGGGGGGGTASSMTPGTSGMVTFVAATAGETYLGTDGLGTGAPVSGQPGQPMAFMIPPMLDACGGSGGGGGGDRRQNPGNPLNSAAAASGSGGGGGIRFSAGGDINIGILAKINCRGGLGGRSSGPGVGYGAGGSGGSIIVQTFGNIILGIAASFDTSGGLPGAIVPGIPDSTRNGEGGRGGAGVVQLEAGSTSFLPVFNMNTTIFGEAVGQIFSFASTVSGTASSTVIDTGSNATDYTAASATLNPGPTGTVTVTVIGIAEDPSNPGTPATTAMSSGGIPLMIGPVDISQFDQLDGYRYFQFQVSASFPAPPATMQGDPLPFADDISISYTP